MSASLVGSEMCIRDRCPSVAAATSSAAEAATAEPRAGRTSAANPPGRGCLLYTSDAADDM
eukprot:14305597-Alexandrium_andersonii.AAC.1